MIHAKVLNLTKFLVFYNSYDLFLEKMQANFWKPLCSHITTLESQSQDFFHSVDNSLSVPIQQHPREHPKTIYFLCCVALQG